jgi:long-chain acyl-CoA synthetase
VPDVHNFADLVRRNAADRGDRPALRSPEEVLTWSELDGQVDAVAADLARIAGGAPVAIALPNGPQFAIAYLATLRAGLVAVPINPGYTGRELRQILGDARRCIHRIRRRAGSRRIDRGSRVHGEKAGPGRSAGMHRRR